MEQPDDFFVKAGVVPRRGTGSNISNISYNRFCMFGASLSSRFQDDDVGIEWKNGPHWAMHNDFRFFFLSSDINWP